VQVLERQAERLHSLLEELLEVSRIETGRFVLHLEQCDLAELVESSMRSLRRLGADGGVETLVEPDVPLIADRDRIERALTAMMLRARALGPVSVEGTSFGDHAELRVSWEGSPLTDEARAHELEPRWQEPQAHRQGLGMALAVAQRAAELHGGSLRVEPDQFVLSLPLRAPAVEHGAQGAGRVLVVDDDEQIARMMAEFLAEHGFVADWAGSGRAALARMKVQPPDVMVLDLRMPEMDGRQLLAAAREAGLSPRVVLLSADRAVADAARELHCEGFVEKPFAPESLLAAVRRAASNHEKHG
jgi:CheY-like chemotaxis protein